MSIKLYRHQVEALEEVLSEPFFALFFEQGTGKTPVAIKAIETRYRQGLINKVLIFAPSSILYNWQIEIHRFLDLPSSEYSIERLNHKKKDKRLKLYKNFLSQDKERFTIKQLKSLGIKGNNRKEMLSQTKPKLLILLINYEKSIVMYKDLKKFSPHFLIVDESHKVKNPNAQTSKNIYKLGMKSNYRLIMTGTPICNGYEDLFMQYKIMDESIFGDRYKFFEYQYIRKGGYMGKEIVGYKNEKVLKDIVHKTSRRILIKDCIKLPPISMEYRNCELNSKAQKAYNDLSEEMLTQINTHMKDMTRKNLKTLCKKYGIVYSPRESYTSLLFKVSELSGISSCKLVITQMIRLHQISGGFLTLDNGESVNISKDKVELVKEIVKETTPPIVIFCQYVPEIELLLRELNSKQLRVKSYRDSKTRDKIYEEFTTGKIDILLLQIRSGSVGLNLQRASKLIFYSWNFSSDDYVQTIARIKRNGQKNPMKVIHLIATNTMDLDILDIVKFKRRLSDKLLN